MKVLALRNSKSGSGYHRLFLPLSKLNAHFTDRLTEDLVSKYDSLWIHYKCDIHPTQLALWRLHYGIQIVLDIDDTWNIPLNHPSYEKVSKAAKYSKLFAMVADWVVCSTPEVEEMVKEVNPNTIIVPNRIPYGEGQYHVRQENKEDFMNRKIRIGFCGSISHNEDWESIRGKMKRVISDGHIKNECEFIVCGVPNLNEMSLPKWIPEKTTQVLKERRWPESKRGQVEKYIFEDHKKQNREWWNSICSILGKPIIKYSRPAENYIDLYREIDILLCPLINNDLTSKKSTLKILEAACTNTYCILGNPYKGKGLECDLYPYEDWYSNIKRLIKDKEKLYNLKINTSDNVRRLYNYNADCVSPRKEILGIKKELNLNVWGITYKDDQKTEYKEYRNTINSVEQKSYLFETNVILNLFKNE